MDEFQDTDPLQAELLLLLASKDPGETRWQHVDPGAGQAVPRRRSEAVDLSLPPRRRGTSIDGSASSWSSAGATLVELRKSFRSVREPPACRQRGVRAGDGRRRRDAAGALRAARAVARGSAGAAVGRRAAGAAAVRAAVRRGPRDRAVAARCGRRLRRVAGASTAAGRSPSAAIRRRRVPLEARHICILFRRFVSYGEDITRAYVDALEARGVKHLLVGGRAFHDREEIETLRAALMAIEWPDDQLSVFATLRGALFAIGDEELLEYHHHAGELPSVQDSARRCPRASSRFARRWRCSPTGIAAATVGRWPRRSPTCSAARARTSSFVLRPGGEQVLANVLHVAELARQYELEGGMSFRGFVEALREAASGGQAAEAPILEEGSDGVRLMTVHKAKGLEFPVVILADITARLTPFDASRYIDTERERCALRIGGWSPKDLNDNKAMELLREEKEGERVAYVAATRARDLLVVPGGRRRAVHRGLGRAAERGDLSAPRTRDACRRRAPGCPAFASKDSVLARPDGDPHRGSPSVRDSTTSRRLANRTPSSGGRRSRRCCRSVRRRRSVCGATI